MITQSPAPTTRVGRGAVTVPRVRSIVVLVVLSLAIFTASAQAHTVTAAAACKTVTFQWTKFAPSGNGNNGLNTPSWTVVFTPTGGAPVTTTGHVSFAGSSFPLTVTIPGGNGSVVASSAWTSSQTRDYTNNSFSTDPPLTISDCPVVVPGPPPPPPPVPPVPPATPASPALSTTASADVTLGEAIHDTALLTGGASATGTITFRLYLASDTTCSTVLDTGSVPVNGDGSYDSAAVTPPSGGIYQWVATYSGDAGNNSAATACNDPNEQATIATQLVQASCIPSPVVLRGLAAKVRTAVSVHVTALGVKSVTFYLDGRKLKTVTKSQNQRFSLKISARNLGYGRHRLQARVRMRNATCNTAAATAAFVKVKPATIRRPQFTG
jgi:hypothetical protein